MIMTMNNQLSTNTVSTLDWLKATENMSISAYDPGSSSQETQVRPAIRGTSSERKSEPMVGTHIRETAETVKRWFKK
jgi:hypothetical protein